MSDRPPITDADVRDILVDIDRLMDEMRFCVEYEPRSVFHFFYPWVMLTLARGLARFALWWK